jgi:hypothetical protein
LALPTSFRLPEDLLKRLDDEASSRGTSVTALVTAVLDEGLKIGRFSGIVYRDGPTGRRAGLAAGPDVWEVIRDLKQTPGTGEGRVELLAEQAGLPVQQIRLALDFYLAFPEGIDSRIAAEARTAMRMRQLIDGRHRLLGT